MSADINLIKSVLSLHDEMASNGFSLVYEGEFSHEVMKMFTSMKKVNLKLRFQSLNLLEVKHFSILI